MRYTSVIDDFAGRIGAEERSEEHAGFRVGAHAPTGELNGYVEVKRFPAPAPPNAHRPTLHVDESREQPNTAVELLRWPVSVYVYLDFVLFWRDDFRVSRRDNNS